MSIVLAAILLQSADPASLEHYRVLTRATFHCGARDDPTTITVCGRRDADRFRVPFIVHNAGDPAHLSVMEEREAWLHKTGACQERGAIPVGCGSVGIGVHAGAGGFSLTDSEERPLAP